jgi:hypothetical protein
MTRNSRSTACVEQISRIRLPAFKLHDAERSACLADVNAEPVTKALGIERMSRIDRTCDDAVGAHCALNEWPGSTHFEQTRGTLAAANAHRDHDVFHLSAPSFDQRVSHESCTGGSVRMSDSDGASVDIQTLIRDSKAIAAVENLHGEGFIELPQPDVFHFDARALQQPGHRKDRADAHFIRFAPRDGEAPEDAERLDAALFRKLRIHDDAGACAI